MILIVIGPSGSGKRTLVGALASEGVVQPHATWTDRPARDAESTIEHVFVSREEFSRLLDNNHFIGMTRLFSHRYGMAQWPEERGALLTVILRANLVDTFIEAAAGEQVVVYQVQAPMARVEASLERKSLSKAEYNARLGEYQAEMALGSMIADRVFINDGPIGELVQAVRSAIDEDTSTIVDIRGSSAEEPDPIGSESSA